VRALGEARTLSKPDRFQQAFVIPLSETITITQWHVPWITSLATGRIFTSFDEAVDKSEMRRQRLQLYTCPTTSAVGGHNDYGFNPPSSKAARLNRHGRGINVHDQWAVSLKVDDKIGTREHIGDHRTRGSSLPQNC